jgi:hypothetical protein
MMDFIPEKRETTKRVSRNGKVVVVVVVVGSLDQSVVDPS